MAAAGAAGLPASPAGVAADTAGTADRAGRPSLLPLCQSIRERRKKGNMLSLLECHEIHRIIIQLGGRGQRSCHSSFSGLLPGTGSFDGFYGSIRCIWGHSLKTTSFSMKNSVGRKLLTVASIEEKISLKGRITLESSFEDLLGRRLSTVVSL